MKGKPGHASGSRQMTSRSPVTHTQKIPFIGTVWPERKKKSIKKEIKKEGQSVVVRLKDTQLHQPSSHFELHTKLHFVWKLEPWSKRRARGLLCHKVEHTRVLFFWNYDILLHVLLFHAWELRNNTGIFTQYSQFQSLMGKAHSCSTAPLWAKAFSVSHWHAGCREDSLP